MAQGALISAIISKLSSETGFLERRILIFSNEYFPAFSYVLFEGSFDAVSFSEIISVSF